MEKNIIIRIANNKGNNNFSGTVLVEDDYKILEEFSNGYANRSEIIFNF